MGRPFFLIVAGRALAVRAPRRHHRQNLTAHRRPDRHVSLCRASLLATCGTLTYAVETGTVGSQVRVLVGLMDTKVAQEIISRLYGQSALSRGERIEIRGVRAWLIDTILFEGGASGDSNRKRQLAEMLARAAAIPRPAR